MPTSKGCTAASLRKNISKLIHEGYPRKRAVAAAFNIQRRSCSCRSARGPRGGRVLRCKRRRR